MHIQFFVGKVLIAVNPFKEIRKIYSAEEMDKYRGESEDLPPHIYSIASAALSAVKNISQSIVILGESGAGKTESTKHIIKFLCISGKNQLVDKLGNATSILDAFGNRKTMKNDNSSRYCKFFEVISIYFYLSRFECVLLYIFRFGFCS